MPLPSHPGEIHVAYTKSTPITLAGGSTPAVLLLPAEAIMVGADGTLVCRLEEDATDRTLTLKAGFIYPLKVISTTQTGSTATGIVALN
jgi:hypothetical protein